MHLKAPPLLAALRRNPTGALLVLAQIAITLAVLCNAASIVAHTIAWVDRPTGFDTRDTFIAIVAPLSTGFNMASTESEDLAFLRARPDVVAASATNGAPLTHDGTFTDLGRSPDATTGVLVQTSMMPMDEQGLRALGVPLVAGRNFRANEIASRSATGKPQRPAEVIVTESLARALFPHGQPLGGTVYEYANQPLTIVGIARDFMGPQAGQPAYNMLIEPETLNNEFYELLVRARPGRRDAVLSALRQHIAAAHPNGPLVHSQTLADAQQLFNTDNRNIAIFLSAVTAVMLAVCCLGLFGLTAFNVSSRTKQIGVRRAVGARRRDIVAHFVAESGLILGGGALLGSVLALAVGQWLSNRYGEPRLDLIYVLGSIVTLGVVGQLAAWQPARRAASVPPSVATRTI